MLDNLTRRRSLSVTLQILKYFISQKRCQRPINPEPPDHILKTSSSNVHRLVGKAFQEDIDTDIFHQVSMFWSKVACEMASRSSRRKGVEKGLSKEDEREDRVNTIELSVNSTTINARTQLRKRIRCGNQAKWSGRISLVSNAYPSMSQLSFRTDGYYNGLLHYLFNILGH